MCLALAGVCCACSLAHAGTLLVNGDFETGDGRGWSVTTTPNGRLGTPMVLAEATVEGVVSRALRVIAGEIEYDGSGAPQGGGIGQVFTVSDAGGYVIGADIAALGQRYVNGDGGRFSLLIDGEAVSSHAFGDIDEGEYQRASLSYTGMLAAGEHSVTIMVQRAYRGVDDITPLQFIDNIEVSAVPEPSRLAMGLIGMVALGGFIGMRRKGG